MNEAAKEETTLELAEESREKEWKSLSFIGELFLGHARFDLIFPYPEQSEQDHRTGDEICKKVSKLLKETLNPDEVDRTGEIPQSVIQGLAQLGCFAIKVPREYGGLGLSQVNYN